MKECHERAEGAKYDKWERVSNEPFQETANNLQHAAKEIVRSDGRGATTSGASPAHQRRGEGGRSD